MSDDTPPDGDIGSGLGSGDHEGGRRQDGKLFKPRNTREDGSYIVGKGRTPDASKFQKGDGRKRGKRPKGNRNLKTVWQDRLYRKHTLKGETSTAVEWVVDAQIRRAINKSDRAAEMVLNTAERFEQASDPKLGMSDQEILSAWFTERLMDVAGTMSDDAPEIDDASEACQGDGVAGDD